MKAVIDRSIALGQPGRSLANKVGAAVVTCGSLGLEDALKDIYFYIVTRPMIPARFVAAYVGPDGYQGMEQCMTAAHNLGRQMVQLAAKKFEYPSEFMGRSVAFGTHTK